MQLRWNTIEVLLGREFLRLKKNPSAVMLLGLLTTIALLLATSRPLAANANKPPRAPTCWVVYWESSEWIETLKAGVPSYLSIHVLHQSKIPRATSADSSTLYPPSDCAIEILASQSANNVSIRYKHTTPKADVLQPFLQWFWPLTTEYFGEDIRFEQETVAVKVEPTRQQAIDKLKSTSVLDLVNIELIGTMIVLMVIFFTCCHFLVSFGSQDRERGTLTALAMTPASTAELLAARFLFHAILSIGVSAGIIAILRPAALAQPMLWGVLILASVGLMSVGTIITAFAKTQSSASLMALCYMLCGGVIFYLATKFSAFTLIKAASFEHYCFVLMYQSMRGSSSPLLIPSFVTMAIIVAFWTYFAIQLFHRRGWR
ncbi:MAG: hypothetical protein CMJ78_24660 [Planctomycetaceae bacterium]|nr:hypothetical protein [Planctomycetaceae bacterium]